MASFTALNVEPESDVEEEIDDSKEIQVEEALKLYQRALKLHAQGPEFYDEAEDAYDALFASEIFKYPEALSEAKRLAKLGDAEDSEDEDLESAPIISGGAEAAPNSLPQILYLSFKNHGEFLVDRLAHQITLERKRNPDFVLEYDEDAKESAKESLDFFAEALDRDETDSDLWRRTSRISRLLGSRRISRYCLEAALNAEGPESISILGSTDLEGMFAKAELRNLVEDIHDHLSLLQSHASLKSSKGLSSSLNALMDPFPRLPAPLTGIRPTYLPKEGQIKAISAPERSWTSIGRTLMARKKAEARDANKVPFGQGYRVSIPSARRSTMDQSDPRTPRKLIAADTLVKRRNTLDSNISPVKNQLEGEAMILDQSAVVESPTLERSNIDIGIPMNNTEIQAEADTKPTDNAENENKSASRSPSARRESSAKLTLKRSSESAGLPEVTESARSRSKRLRSRIDPTPTVEEDVDPKALLKQQKDLLEPHAKADEWLFGVADRISSKIAITNFKSMAHMRQNLWPDDDQPLTETNEPLLNALKDFKASLASWDLNKSTLLLHGSGSGASVTLIDNADDSGLASFLEHSKPANRKVVERDVLLGQGLDDFVDSTNQGWRDLDEISSLWIEWLVKPSSDNPEARYLQNIWPTTLKETVPQFLVEEDHCLYSSYETQATKLDEAILTKCSSGDLEITLSERALMELIQSLFELHVDIYGKMTNASSKVDQPTRVQQKDRMRRWATLASQAIGKHVSLEEVSEELQFLTFRHLWATVIYVSLIDPGSREHVLLCLKDLKRVLEETGSPIFSLPNNSIMPEISAGAAEREIARLTTMDFFLQIFDPDSEDPLAVIESLEPILMSTGTSSLPPPNAEDRIIPDSQELESQEISVEESRAVAAAPPSSQQKHMSEFLRKASSSLRLSLWHRLKAAYEKIEYPPMVLVCNFKSIDIILTELKGQTYSKESTEDRSANLMVWIRNLSDLVTQCLDLIRAKANALDCIDETHLSLAMATSADATKLFHVFALWEDAVRVGQSSAPVQASGAVVSHKSAMNFLRDMQPKCWMLHYFLFQETVSQHKEHFSLPRDDLAEFLMAAHNTFGGREYCRVGKKAFLKLMKTELIHLEPTGDWDLEIAQLVYDLYGLKICPASTVLEEHGCNADPIERSSALELVEPLMVWATRLNIKDVLRSEIKTACEKMQAVIGTPRANSTHQSFNRRMMLAYLKSPINPINLYRALRGVGGLSGMPVRTDYSNVANKHWFFLQGHLLLARYRSQKRTSADTSSDLDDAITFFKLDLDFDMDRWESWYRLAQAYDAKIEEDVTWNADKINDPKSELVTLQRNSINCYTTAIAIAIGTADQSFETVGKLSELYTDFGNRIYASSREPFSMKAFSLHEYERFCNAEVRGTYRREPFREMKEAQAWHFASELFRQALAEKPDNWINWYMRGKCLWKLHQRQGESKVAYSEVLNTLVKAIQCVPEKRDSRHPDKDPILEPHYKLVSIVYKLVHGHELQIDEGVKVLAATPHARKVQYTEADGWQKYILRVLKSLRSADKANWHHRMVARAAHIVYDDMFNDPAAAEAAKQELGQQIFTKTMTIQVWRPENERAGRHFVYTTRYTHFFISLLEQIKDKASLELLCKRLRRKQSDFIDHPQVWAELCSAYLKLIRAQAQIPEGHEDAVFKFHMSYELFALNAGRLEAWGHSEASQGHRTMDVLREVIELKKLNGNYMKAAMIDDLVGDTYAKIYEEIVPGLIAKADEAENRDRMRIDRMLMKADSPAPEATQSDQPSAPSRPKSIGKTEVRKRADALVSKITAPSMHWRTKAAKEAKEAAAAQLEVPSLHDENKSASASVAGSIHDSADDESELSDINDVEEPEGVEDIEAETAEDARKSLFPGLMTKSRRDDEGDGETGEDVSMGEGGDNEEYDTAHEKQPDGEDGEAGS